MTPPDCAPDGCRAQVLWLLDKWRSAELRATLDAERASREITRLRRRLRAKRRRGRKHRRR